MKERPILFSAPMVRALLAGTKTQTRRIARLKPTDLGKPLADDEFAHGIPLKTCPYGQPGDRLWVRERWAPRDGLTLINRQRSEVFYWADDEAKHWSDGPWKPSIHMPRWASRITLEVAGVRVERLQDISEADARAEGAAAPPHLSYRDGYAWLWDSINGPGAWDLNPYVWCISFRVLER